jgi:hypothetical protein
VKLGSCLGADSIKENPKSWSEKSQQSLRRTYHKTAAIEDIARIAEAA